MNVKPYKEMALFAFMSRGTFFLSYLRHPHVTGSITPSSRFLVGKLLEPLDTSTFKQIVELGAGDGRVTKSLLEKFGTNCVLLSFEIDQKLTRYLPRANNLTVIHDDVLHMRKHLKTHHLQEVDYIISSVPLANFPKAKRRKLLDIVASSLKHDGLFVQYQYSLLSLKDLREVFSNVTIRFTPLNVPPAFVYVCTK